MLLPSAMSCDVRIQPPQQSYTTATRMLSPPPSTCPSPNSPLSTNIYSTCRALQSLLTTSLPTYTASSRPARRLASPIALTQSSRAPSRTKSAKITKHPHTPPPASRKRRRCNSDTNEPSCDQENLADSKPSTPKRKRRAPPSLPLGLAREDFEALEPSPQAPRTPFQSQPDMMFSTPSQPIPFPMPSFASRPAAEETSLVAMNPEDTGMTDDWTTSDDNALVETILNKLRLRQSDWNDCARRLGKEGKKDSLGERWKVLVGDSGEIGLRRSSGLQRRKNVQTMEFGPELARP